MKPRRILIFSLVYYPRYIGGAEVAVKEITDRISPEEIEFDMVTIRTERAAFERIGNINIHRIGVPWYGNPKSPFFYAVKYFYMPLALIAALRLHKKNKYDATWSIMANYASAPALFFKWFHKKVPFILTLQEGDPFEHIRKRVHITYPFFKKLFGIADHIQAISTYLADWAKSMGATCPIDVVPNAVDYEKFAQAISPERRKEIRSSVGVADNEVLLVTASRLVKKNAVDVIIDSLVSLNPIYKLLVLGSGEDEKKLKEQVTRLKLDGRVIFKGFVPHLELPAYLQSSDIFIRPSRSEGLGNSFLEAMAAGIPVIATRVGGIPDFLIDGETGLFCEVDHPRSITQKVEKLSKDKESREYIIKRAREMVKEKYGWDRVAGEMKGIYNGQI